MNSRINTGPSSRAHSFELWLLLAIVPALVQCQARYIEHPGTLNLGSSSGQGANGAVLEYQTRVAVAAYAPPQVDITWIIDNSGSMTEEAAAVRTNFANFINSVNVDADLKVALISREGDTGTNVRMPNPGPDAMQIDYYVGSTDALEVTAAAFCERNPAPGTYCRNIRDNALSGGLGTIAGDLAPFLRATSKKAFVVVTDDETRIPGSQFLGAFDEVWSGQKPVVYGFIGFNAGTSPCAASEGLRYQELTRATNGTVFNVCDKDWSPAFSQIASHVIRLASIPIAIPVELTGAVDILAVELNGTTVEPGRYSLTADGLFFDPALTRGLSEANVRIVYQRR